jgi:STELLO glycosyltransferases
LKTALIITSIAPPNDVLRGFAEQAEASGFEFILIGDVPSPKDFRIAGCRFFGVEAQQALPFRLAKLLPLRHYARKNLGYLLAKNNDVIVETDDDNIPFPAFWDKRSRSHEARIVDAGGWINVYRYFSGENVWPRGFPLESVQAAAPAPRSETVVSSPIQQGLADENPDVDAVYRLVSTLPLSFEKNQPIVLRPNSWCPFNSQNTTWFREAFPLLYLPSFCTFRMTDIWRSLVAQRIAWTCGWDILFHASTVRQERNEHNLLKDFADEIPGYLNNARIGRTLEALPLKEGVENLSSNLLSCYRALVELAVIGKEELPLVEAWIADMASA